MEFIKFDTELGWGYIEFTKRDNTGRNDTYTIIVDEVYGEATEEQVIEDIEDNLFNYINSQG